MRGLHSLDGTLVESVPPEFALCPYGVFTTFVLVDGSVLGWRDHIARLAHDARTLWGHELDETGVNEALYGHAATLTAPSTVRITLYPNEISITWPQRAHGCRILVSSRTTEFPFVPESGFTVGTAEFQRDLPTVKSTGLLGQIRLRRDAQLAGHDDVLFRRGSEVLEGATWAVVVWRKGEVITPAGPVLPSITAKHLAGIAEALGWKFRAGRIGIEDLAHAELVQAASANHPARSIASVDGQPINQNGDLLQDLAREYSTLSMQATR